MIQIPCRSVSKTTEDTSTIRVALQVGLCKLPDFFHMITVYFRALFFHITQKRQNTYRGEKQKLKRPICL